MSSRKPFILYQKAAGGKGGKVWYAAFWSAEEGRYIKRTSTHTVDRGEAALAAEEIIRRGIVPSAEDPPVSQYLAAFWTADSFYARAKALRHRELSPRYIELCSSAVRLYIATWPAFKRLRVSELTPGAADKWMLHLQGQGKSARTTNIALQALRVAVRRWAKSRRLPDPLEGFQKAAEDKQSRGSLSLAEIKALLDCRTYIDPADKKMKEIDARARAGVLLATLAGLRLGECRGLTWEDVDEEKGIITIRQSIPVGEKIPRKPKWGSAGEVPAMGPLMEELAEIAEQSPLGKIGYVLYADLQGKPIGSDTLTNGFARMLKAIGIPAEEQKARRLSFHSTRHAFVSLARLAGLADFLVQRYARHKTPMMMEQYSHANILDIEEARRKLGNAVRPKKKKAG
jgi:integrase